MAPAAAAWDVLSKAANLAQLSGLHAAVLVAVLTTLLRVYHSNRRECARLEQSHRRMLDEMLQSPTTGCGRVALLLCSSEMGDPFGEALADAAGLVQSYKGSTLWRRVRSGGRMAAQLREMQHVIDSYRGCFLLLANAHLLLQQQAVHHHHDPIPPSSDARTTRIPEVNTDDTSQSPSAQAVTTSGPAVVGTPRTNDIGLRGTDNDPASTGSDRNVPNDLLPIVISTA